MPEDSYNPLAKRHLGESVSVALLQKHPLLFEDLVPFDGAGIYAIYYVGDHPSYREIAHRNRNAKFDLPIYVGKAIPPGAQKGNFGLDTDAGRALHKRLLEHFDSIKSARTTLKPDDFLVRYLVVDDIWIPLGESLLIGKYQPAWNMLLPGFGNHDPGSGRHKQQRSPWDVVHPGRKWAEKLATNSMTREQILSEFEKGLLKVLT